MQKFIHSADWQLGCPFRSFGAAAASLRAERIRTLRHVLELARAEKVDGFLIAGDLFEDNQVCQSLVMEVAALFSEFPDVPIFISPGNHDPVTGPGCIWMRPPFDQPPSHVKIFREPGFFPIGDGFLIGNPLRQKLSTQDPSARLGQIAGTLPDSAVKIGMTHGALAIPGKHQSSDHPIHLEAATSHGLAYLALGHWHSWQIEDAGRMLIPGTPEPDAFGHADGRFVALLEIASAGAAPFVRQIEVAGLVWREITLDFLHGPAGRRVVERSLAELEPAADRTVLRLTLTGATGRRSMQEALAWIEPRLKRFRAFELLDDSTLGLSAHDVSQLREHHPLLSQVLSDLSQIRGLATGRFELAPGVEMTLPAPELQGLLAEHEIELPLLDEQFFKTSADLLGQMLQEAGA